MGPTNQSLDVELGSPPDALARVMTVLRRRQCKITSIDYVARDRHYGGRLVIGVAAPPAHAHCVPAWLENLVDVRAVRQARRPAAPETPEPTGSRPRDTSALLC